MSGYTKLFSDIVLSTVWREANEVKVLWITMLAIKDRYHIVNASIPGLAHSAGVTLKECEIGLEVLSSPDPYSRSPEFEGRRIEVCEGGWLILNGEKYREKLSKEDRREQQRRWQQGYRDRKKAEKDALGVDTNVDQTSTPLTHSDTEADTDKKNILFEAWWNLYDLKQNKPGCEKKWNALSEADQSAAMEHTKRYVASTPNKQFRKSPHSYLHKRTFKDEIICRDKAKDTTPQRVAKTKNVTCSICKRVYGAMPLDTPNIYECDLCHVDEPELSPSQIAESAKP